MNPPSQTIVPGKLQRSFEHALQALVSERVAERLHAQDVSLWPVAEQEGSSSRRRIDLHWLDLPVSVAPPLEQVAHSAQAALDEGFHQWVLMALGDAGFAAFTLLPLISLRPGLQFFVLDCVDPSAIRKVESQLDLLHTFFILASKSGDKLEESGAAPLLPGQVDPFGSFPAPETLRLPHGIRLLFSQHGAGLLISFFSLRSSRSAHFFALCLALWGIADRIGRFVSRRRPAACPRIAPILLGFQRRQSSVAACRLPSGYC